MPWPLLLAAHLAAVAVLAGAVFGIGLIRDDHPGLAACVSVAFLVAVVALGERDERDEARR
jgi:hypothetical protein